MSFSFDVSASKWSPILSPDDTEQCADLSVASSLLMLTRFMAAGPLYLQNSWACCSVCPTGRTHTHTNPLFSWSHPGEPELLAPRGCRGYGPLQSCQGFTHQSWYHCLATAYPPGQQQLLPLGNSYSQQEKKILNINNMVYRDKSPLHFC